MELMEWSCPMCPAVFSAPAPASSPFGPMGGLFARRHLRILAQGHVDMHVEDFAEVLAVST